MTTVSYGYIVQRLPVGKIPGVTVVEAIVRLVNRFPPMTLLPGRVYIESLNSELAVCRLLLQYGFSFYCAGGAECSGFAPDTYG